LRVPEPPNVQKIRGWAVAVAVLCKYDIPGYDDGNHANLKYPPCALALSQEVLWPLAKANGFILVWES
jgi:hypothetical protein